MKKIRNILLSCLVFLPSLLSGQERTDTLTISLDQVTDEYLDTVNVEKAFQLNDYATIGVEYAYGLSLGNFNPVKRRGMLETPLNVGVYFTHYERLFNTLPYFGLQIGLCKGQDGYRFKYDEKDGTWSSHVDGATEVTYDYFEVPAMVLGHLDLPHFKLMAGGGLYGGYRYKVHRVGESSLGFNPDFSDTFRDYERKFDYGWTGKAGIGFVFDPVELHFTGRVRYGLHSLYDPDYMSEYYYRFAYPFDILISAGVHIQLTKRTGRTARQLRLQARESVYHPEP